MVQQIIDRMAGNINALKERLKSNDQFKIDLVQLGSLMMLGEDEAVLELQNRLNRVVFDDEWISHQITICRAMGELNVEDFRTVMDAQAAHQNELMNWVGSWTAGLEG